MRIEQLIEIATKTAKGKDNFEEGAVGSNGYGFVFKDPNSKIKYITDIYSHKYCEAGSMRAVVKNWEKFKDFRALKELSNGIWDDLLLVGSLKSLVPNLQFGGFSLFDAWMFVRTPKRRMFPATFYWAQSGLSIGGWTSYDIDPFARERIFPEERSQSLIVRS